MMMTNSSKRIIRLGIVKFRFCKFSFLYVFLECQELANMEPNFDLEEITLTGKGFDELLSSFNFKFSFESNYAKNGAVWS